MSNDEALVEARRRLVEEIAAEARSTRHWTGRAAYAPTVMDAIARVPRHEFVPARERSLAYINRPLAIGHGQTISQPYIVAVMTDLLDLRPTNRVLEIGTGCGYQAAVLAELAAHVDTVEVVPALAAQATDRLAALGYSTISIHLGDGWKGWPEGAPYDAIIVTAAPPEVPKALLEQLGPGGRMVVPVGQVDATQTLVRCVKDAGGAVTMKDMLPVAFVPMVHRH
jgi:protein-L-isoaspartate(D-aspartate) O-methyltransferase